MAAIIDFLRTRQEGDVSSLIQDNALISKDVGLAYYSDSRAGLIDKSDEKEMISWWRVSTSCMDREGDVLVPKGCLESIKSYVDNPAVCFEHKKQYQLPIGTSIGKSGLPLDVSENEIVAGCKHIVHNAFTSDVWTLVVNDVLKGCSISFVPLSGERIKEKAHRDDGKSFVPRYLIKKWNITEWSLCSVGINPEATRMQVSRGYVKSPEMLQYLEPLAEKPKVWSNGADIKDDEDMIDFETIDKSTIAGIRFHKSQFAAQEDCQKWLSEKGLDSSLLTDNPKSWDYAQSSEEVSEKSDKVGDGLYVLYTEKTFPPTQPDQKKKKPKSGVKPGEDRPMKPGAPAPGGEKPGAAKPGAGEFPPKKGEEGEEDEVSDEEELDEDGNPIAGEQEAANIDPAQAQAQAASTPGTMTYSARSFVDILKHKAAECAYLQAQLGMHDHDGLTALMQEELKMCQERQTKWLQAAQGAFPDLNFAQLTSLEEEEEDLDDTGNLEQQQNSDKLNKANNLGKSLSDDDLDEVLLGLALMDLAG